MELYVFKISKHLEMQLEEVICFKTIMKCKTSYNILELILSVSWLYITHFYQLQKYSN